MSTTGKTTAKVFQDAYINHDHVLNFILYLHIFFYIIQIKGKSEFLGVVTMDVHDLVNIGNSSEASLLTTLKARYESKKFSVSDLQFVFDD